MSDPYRIHDIGGTHPGGAGPAARDGGGRGLRTALWVALVVSGAANAGTSMSGLSPLLSLAFGVATLLCVVALVAHHVRGRRR
jgi:hypothetical protein